MSKANYNAICDVCGWKMDASLLQKRWDGLMVCEKDWEPRNILDFYRPRLDAHLLPFTRPDNDGIDVGVAINPTTQTFLGFCTPTGKLSYAGFGVAGCLIAGNVGTIY